LREAIVRDYKLSEGQLKKRAQLIKKQEQQEEQGILEEKAKEIQEQRLLEALQTFPDFQIKAFRALSLMVEPVSFAAFLKDEFLSACRLCMMELRKRTSTVSMIRIAGQRGEEDMAKAA